MNDFVLNWDKKINKHTINLLGLAETQKTIYDGYHVTVTNFQSDETGYDNLSAGDASILLTIIKYEVCF